MTPDRRAESARFLAVAADWAARRSDVRALALVGSWARDAAQMDSDVDLVLLTDDVTPFTMREDWTRELGAQRVIRTLRWGVITEVRLALPSGLEIDVGVGTAAWASITPLEPGTRRVVACGHARPL